MSLMAMDRHIGMEKVPMAELPSEPLASHFLAATNLS